MISRFRRRLVAHLAGWLTAGLLCAPAAAVDFPLEQAQALAAKGDNAAAYDMLARLADERAGDFDFDLAFGRIAFAAGRLQPAVFALERAALSRPDDPDARLLLARVYRALGESENALAELNRLLARNPPPEIETAASALRKELRRPAAIAWRASADLQSGYDSNVNAGPSLAQVAIPGVGSLLLAPGARKFGDGFALGTARLEAAAPIGDDWLVTGAVGGTTRNTFSGRYDYWSADASATVRRAIGAGAIWAGGSAQRLDYGDAIALPGGDYGTLQRVAGGIVAGADFPLGAYTGSVQAQHARILYDPPSQKFRNASRNTFAAVIGRPPARSEPASWSASIYTGNERPDSPSVPQLGYRFYGARVALDWRFGRDTRVTVAASDEVRLYDTPDPLLLLQRRDAQRDAQASVAHGLSRLWEVYVAAGYGRNGSNLELYQWNRAWSAAGVRLSY